MADYNPKDYQASIGGRLQSGFAENSFLNLFERLPHPPLPSMRITLIDGGSYKSLCRGDTVHVLDIPYSITRIERKSGELVLDIDPIEAKT